MPVELPHTLYVRRLKVRSRSRTSLSAWLGRRTSAGRRNSESTPDRSQCLRPTSFSISCPTSFQPIGDQLRWNWKNLAHPSKVFNQSLAIIRLKTLRFPFLAHIGQQTI